MLADKSSPHGEGMFAVPRTGLFYPAFEHLIAHHAGAARLRVAEQFRKFPADELFETDHI